MNIKWAMHSYVYTQNIDLENNWHLLAEDARKAGFSSVEVFLRDFSTDDSAEAVSAAFHKADVGLLGASYNAKLWDPKERDKILSEITTWGRRLKEAGGELIGLSTLPQPEGEKGAKEYDIQAEILTEAAQAITECGLFLAYHTYAPDGFNNAREIQELADRLDSDVFRLGPDLCWLYRGGADPAAFVRSYGELIDFLHVRDEADEVWSETIGEGAIDWEDVGQALREINFSGWVCVELADTDGVTYTRSLMERHRVSREYLESVWKRV